MKMADYIVDLHTIFHSYLSFFRESTRFLDRVEQNLPTQPAAEPEDTEQALEELEQKFAVLRKTREAVVFFCSFQMEVSSSSWGYPNRNGWFISMEKPKEKEDDWGFPILGNHQMRRIVRHRIQGISSNTVSYFQILSVFSSFS